MITLLLLLVLVLVLVLVLRVLVQSIGRVERCCGEDVGVWGHD